MNFQGVFYTKFHHSCDGRNPENIETGTWMFLFAGITEKIQQPVR